MIAGRQCEVSIQDGRVMNGVHALTVDINAYRGYSMTAASGGSGEMNWGSDRCACSGQSHGD